MGSVACWLQYQRFGKKNTFCVSLRKAENRVLVGLMDGLVERKKNLTKM
jgi:hypothetical protein